MSELDKHEIPYEIIPGVSSVFAAAAALKTELTSPRISQTLILTRQAGRTPVPHGQEIANLAKHNATMAIFLSADNTDELVSELIRGGYTPETPASVVYKASWKDEKIIKGTLADISARLKKAGIGRQAMIVVGSVLEKKNRAKSLLYDASFSHNYRKAKNKSSENNLICQAEPVFKGKIAIYAINKAGILTAGKLAGSMKDTKLFVPIRFKGETPDKGVRYIGENAFDAKLAENWRFYQGHIFIMAAGIVVRKIAPLLKSKTSDPAVVVCDQAGNYAISLLSGHIGGANRLAKIAASKLGGQAVISTATDVRNLTAFDEMASIEGWTVLTPETIKILNAMLLEGKKIAVNLPEKNFEKYYAGKKNIYNVKNPRELKNGNFDGAVILDEHIPKIPIPVMKLSSRGKNIQ
jgi:hypothetical protein